MWAACTFACSCCCCVLLLTLTRRIGLRRGSRSHTALREDVIKCCADLLYQSASQGCQLGATCADQRCCFMGMRICAVAQFLHRQSACCQACWLSAVLTSATARAFKNTRLPKQGRPCRTVHHSSPNNTTTTAMPAQKGAAANPQHCR